jgi:adenylate cyclase
VERRLTAILAADVVDYTRLMGEDEARTLAALNTLRENLFQPTVARLNGNVIKRMGDGWIVEFANVSEAVTCAVQIQENLSGHELICLRIGVHIGDVTFQDDDIYGDGINVAARLEALAKPGQVLISDTVHHSLDGIATEDFFGGEPQQLKNVARSVGVWRWPVDSELEFAAPGGGGDTPLSLPDKPSIAVLPFDNMSGDSEQEYFSDGMTEDIITALSRLRWLFVIARNSTFTYKGQAVDVTQVGRELGVRYVLEGSVRKAGDRVRVTAQLIDAESGNHIWAKRYERNLVDIFDLQDELTEAITAQVDAELAGSERNHAHKKSATDLDAWDTYQRGMWHLYKNSREDMAEARRLFENASVRAPEFASAFTGLAVVGSNEVLFGYTVDKAVTLSEALRHIEMALKFDDRDSYSHYVLGRLCMFSGYGERAISAFTKAIELNPNSGIANYGLAYAFLWFGRAPEAISLFDRAIHLSPNDPLLWGFLIQRSYASALIGNYDDAIQNAKASANEKGDEFWPYTWLAFAYALIDDNEKAQSAVKNALDRNSDLSVTYVKKTHETMHPDYLDVICQSLRKAGLPEE